MRDGLLKLDHRSWLVIDEIPDPAQTVIMLFGVRLRRRRGESRDDTKRRIARALLRTVESKP
jgi:hypothetical protein